MKGEREVEKEPVEENEELPVRWDFKKGDINCPMLLLDQAG